MKSKPNITLWNRFIDEASIVERVASFRTDHKIPINGFSSRDKIEKWSATEKNSNDLHAFEEKLITNHCSGDSVFKGSHTLFYEALKYYTLGEEEFASALIQSSGRGVAFEFSKDRSGEQTDFEKQCVWIRVDPTATQSDLKQFVSEEIVWKTIRLARTLAGVSKPEGQKVRTRSKTQEHKRIYELHKMKLIKSDGSIEYKNRALVPQFVLEYSKDSRRDIIQAEKKRQK